MTKADCLKYENLIKAKLIELGISLQNKDDIQIERAADPVDLYQYQDAILNAANCKTRETTMLRQIEEAIRRMQEGTYGTCSGCNKPISPKRLNAIPWAELCTKCQATQETENSDSIPVGRDLSALNGGRYNTSSLT